MRIRGHKQKTNNKMTDLSSNISINTLKINALNSQIKRQRLTEYIKIHTHTHTTTIQGYAVHKKLTSNIMTKGG